MFKVYFPFQWLVKGILLVLLGLILFGSYLTIKDRYFPEQKPIKIVTKDLKIGETYQADGVELTFKNIELTEKRNEFAQHDRVLQVTYTLKNDTENLIRPQQWTIENESEEIGRMADENKVVPLETLVINKEEFEQLFLDFFVQYDRIYDFSSSLDLFELEAEIIENSREENGKIIISVEKFNELFSETFEIDTDYYQPQEVFQSFRNQIIRSGKTVN